MACGGFGLDMDVGEAAVRESYTEIELSGGSHE
jgi:hypothetical protein